jgi:hypothetical protein
MISGGQELLVSVGSNQYGLELRLLPAAAMSQRPVHRPADVVHYQALVQSQLATRDIAKDSGWVGGQGNKRGRDVV